MELNFIRNELEELPESLCKDLILKYSKRDKNDIKYCEGRGLLSEK